MPCRLQKLNTTKSSKIYSKKRIVLVALLALLLGAPLFLSPTYAQDGGGLAHDSTQYFDWSAPTDLVARTRLLSNSADQELEAITAWLGLERAPRGRLIWVQDRDELDSLLGYPSPAWFAAVTQVGKNRIIMVVDAVHSQEQLHTTLRHELVHWAMQGIGVENFTRLPAWFHEGVAEAWVDQHLLGSLSAPLGLRAYRNELPHLFEYNGGFGREPLHASEGYALSYEFVEMLTRRHGQGVVAEIMAQLKGGRSLDAALFEVIGLGIIDLEQEMRAELGSLSRILADLYPQFFLLITLLLLIGFPFAMRRRRRRWERVQARWRAEELESEEALDAGTQTHDDRLPPSW
jgi:hypothetical protein